MRSLQAWIFHFKLLVLWLKQSSILFLSSLQAFFSWGIFLFIYWRITKAEQRLVFVFVCAEYKVVIQSFRSWIKKHSPSKMCLKSKWPRFYYFTLFSHLNKVLLSHYWNFTANKCLEVATSIFSHQPFKRASKIHEWRM